MVFEDEEKRISIKLKKIEDDANLIIQKMNKIKSEVHSINSTRAAVEVMIAKYFYNRLKHDEVEAINNKLKEYEKRFIESDNQ